MDATDVDEYTALDSRMTLLLGSKWSVSLPETYSIRTPETPLYRRTASAACAPVNPRRFCTRE